jgi:SAM-dependent methyltransferase
MMENYTCHNSYYVASAEGGAWYSMHLDTIMPLFSKSLFEKMGNKVLQGPFSGMEIPHDIVWDQWMVGPLLMGLYETELHDTIKLLIARQPKIIFNIGCAAGYYAIGFARNVPGSIVHAYDIEERSLAIVREYAERNGVGDRVITTRGITNPKKFPIPVPDSLYISDCEGFEEIFFWKGEYFACSDLLIECHHSLDDITALKPVIDVLQPRFRDSHDVTVLFPSNSNVLFRLSCEWPMLTQYSTLIDSRPQGHCWMLALSKQKKI